MSPTPHADHPHSQVFRTATPDDTVPAVEPRPAIVVPASHVFGDLHLQPLDLAVLIYLLFQPRGTALNHTTLVTNLQNLGWRSANGQPIGRDAIYTTLTHLITAGLLTRHQDRGPDGRLGPAVFTLHNEPAPTPPREPSPTTDIRPALPVAAVPGIAVAGNTPNGDTETHHPPSPQVNTAPANDGHGAAPPTPPGEGEVTNPPPNPPQPGAKPAAPDHAAPPPDGTTPPARRPRRTRRTGKHSNDTPIGNQPTDHENANVPPLDGPAPSPEQHQSAIEILTALPRKRPDLHLGATDLRTLAPLAAQWLARGATPDQLSYALTTGLPTDLIRPAGILRNRLTRKMPTPPQPTTPAPPRRAVTADDDGTNYAALVASRAAYANATEPARTAALAAMRTGLRRLHEGRV